MLGESPGEEAKSSSYYQNLEGRMLFDPDLISKMLEFNTKLLGNATDPTEIAELSYSEIYLKELLQRLEF